MNDRKHVGTTVDSNGPSQADLRQDSSNWDEDLSGSPAARYRRLGEDGATYPIGFIQVTFNATNGHAVGGMLVSDNTGIPLEFTITNAVRPTRAQQVLYGKRLQSYIAVNLCAVQLVNAVKNRPSVIFVPDESMLSLHSFTDIPVLVLRKGDALGTAAATPTVVAPRQRPEYEDVIDLSSLDADMLDAFDRIEKCREVLASRNEDYRI